jgi:hypothetical protein
MNSVALRVLSGKHAGAIVQLLAEKSWSIGHGENADILLLDEEVRERHACLAWVADDEAWHLTAMAEEVRVFGYPLKPATTAVLMPGSCFSMSGLDFEVAMIARLDEWGRPIAKANTQDAGHQARMRFLHHAHPWRYRAAVMRSTLQPRYIVAAVGVMACSAAVVAVLLSRPELSVEYLEDAVAELDRLYPDVSHQLDPVTGITTYKGYVKDQQELGALRQLALKANFGAVIMNVLPMDVLALNVSSMTETYYRSPEVKVIGPGEIEVDIWSEDAIKDLAGWNMRAVEAKVLRELPELKAIRLRLKQSNMPLVSVPLEKFDLSIISASSGEPFVVNQRGDRLFSGAQIKEGHLNFIDLCRVELISSEDKTRFDMHALKGNKSECN